MKKIFGLLACLAIGFQSFAQGDLPTTTIKDLNGANIAFNKTVEPGKVTIISFWATWCVPCKKEIKTIQEKLPNWKEQANIDYMTISIDDSRATARVKSFARAQGWEFPAYQDPNSDLKRAINFQTVPYTIIVDKEGKIVYRHGGFEEGSEDEIFRIAKEFSEK